MNNFFLAVNTPIRQIFFQLYLFFSAKKFILINTWGSLPIKQFFPKKARIVNNDCGSHKGLYYELQIESIKLADQFFDQIVEKSFLIKSLNKYWKTDKSKHFFVKYISYDIFDLLYDLHFVAKENKEATVFLFKNPLNLFVTQTYFENKPAIPISWVSYWHYILLLPFLYTALLMQRVVLKGISFKKRKPYKIFVESVWGRRKSIFRDDILIDGTLFKKEDIIFYSRNTAETYRNKAVQELKAEGYEVVAMQKMALNIRYLASAFGLLFLNPLIIIFRLLLSKNYFLTEYCVSFHTALLPHFIFLSNYPTKVHSSRSDHAEIAETIAMNYFGCKNVLYYWSDLAVYKDMTIANTTHNLLLAWGDCIQNFYKEKLYFDKISITGCYVLEAIFEYKKTIIPSNRKKIVVCDSDFSNYFHQTEQIYIDQLDLCIALVKQFPETDIAFKIKGVITNKPSLFTQTELRTAFEEKITWLQSQTNFLIHDYKYSIEYAIAESSVLINMCFNSPATIALLAGHQALFYDKTGNNQSPFSVFKNEVVFENEDLIVEQVKQILAGKKSVFDVIPTELLDSFDPFRDGKAMQRMRQIIYEQTL